jgi:hypothetical protein
LSPPGFGDDEIRRLIKGYEGAADRTFEARLLKSPAEAIRALNEAAKERAESFVAVNNRVGERLSEYG